MPETWIQLCNQHYGLWYMEFSDNCRYPKIWSFLQGAYGKAWSYVIETIGFWSTVPYFRTSLGTGWGIQYPARNSFFSNSIAWFKGTSTGSHSFYHEYCKWLGMAKVCPGAEPMDRLSAFPLNWQTHMAIWLVVWNIFYFSIYWKSSSQLTFIFFRGVGQPPASYKVVPPR